MAKERALEGGFFPLKQTVTTALGAMVMTAILLFFASLAMTYTSAPIEVMEWTVTALMAVCVFFAGLICARGRGKNGLLCGAVSGLFYACFLFLTGSLILGELSPSADTVLTLLLSLGCGAAGGIVGVNAGYKKRKRRK